jgi:hypothetical protein
LAALSRIAASSALRAVQMPGGRLENDAACWWRQRERLAAAQRNRERDSIDSADQSGVNVYKSALEAAAQQQQHARQSGGKRMPPLLGGSIFEQTGFRFVNMKFYCSIADKPLSQHQPTVIAYIHMLLLSDRVQQAA